MNNLGDPSKGTEDFPSLRELMKGRLGGSFMHCNSLLAECILIVWFYYLSIYYL